MKQKIKVQGRLRIYVDGKLRADHANLVVDSGLDAIVRGFGGAASKNVLTFEAGDGTLAPSVGDTGLNNSTFGPKALTSIAYPAIGTIRVTFDIIPGEATGQDFQEFGLFNASGDLVARWVDAAVFSKTAGNTIQGVWDIELSL